MNIISTKKLAGMLVERRKKYGMTQDQLGERTGINRAMIGRIEREDYLPTIPQLEKLFEVLHLTMEDVTEKSHYAVYTAFRGKNLTAEEQEGVTKLFQMMGVAKQQIMLRKALHDHE